MRLRLSALLVVVVMLVMGLVLPAAAQTTPTVTDEAIGELTRLIETSITEYDIPGMAAAVIANGNIVFAQGFGLRDVENELPFTEKTRFRIGSTTKSMTSLLIAQLVAEGYLAWDTPVTELFPTFATSASGLAEQITLRDLMGMATGLESSALDGFDWGQWTVDDLLEAIANQRSAGAFGEHYSYNNEVYALAGYAAAAGLGEVPSLETYRTLVQQRIFDPIGMTSAIITDNHADLGDNFALPYETSLEPGSNIVRMDDPPIGIVAPAGGVWTTVEDMARYLMTQMNGGIAPDGTRIVDEAALLETWQPGVTIPDAGTSAGEVAYGMGWVTLTYNGIPIRYHDGGWSGYATQMVTFPEANIGLVLFANSSTAQLLNQSIAFGFAESLYEKPLEAFAAAQAQITELGTQIEQARAILNTPFDPEAAATLLGEYEEGWRVSAGEDALVLARGAWSFRMLPLPYPGMYLVVNNGGAGVQVQFTESEVSITMAVQLPTEAITVNKVNS